MLKETKIAHYTCDICSKEIPREQTKAPEVEFNLFCAPNGDTTVSAKLTIHFKGHYAPAGITHVCPKCVISLLEKASYQVKLKNGH